MNDATPSSSPEEQIKAFLRQVVLGADSGADPTRVAAQVVGLIGSADLSPTIDASPALQYIVEDLACDLEIANGDVDAMWQELVAAVADFVATA